MSHKIARFLEKLFEWEYILGKRRGMVLEGGLLCGCHGGEVELDCGVLLGGLLGINFAIPHRVSIRQIHSLRFVRIRLALRTMTRGYSVSLQKVCCVALELWY